MLLIEQVEDVSCRAKQENFIVKQNEPVFSLLFVRVQERNIRDEKRNRTLSNVDDSLRERIDHY
jgi:hypothetical protein